jgi:hypothetical protein
MLYQSNGRNTSKIGWGEYWVMCDNCLEMIGVVEKDDVKRVGIYAKEKENICWRCKLLAKTRDLA